MTLVAAVGWIALAFAIGSIPFGIVVARLFFHTDLRASGSGNIGAANAARTLGPAGGALVLVLDALKGFVPVFPHVRQAHVLAAPALAGGHLTAAAVGAANAEFVLACACALAALLGHCYSPWLRFRGGKGVATHLGALFAIAWPVGLAFVVAWLGNVIPTRYASLGSLVATFIAIFALGAFAGFFAAGYGVLAAIVIFWRHRENIARLRAGTENRVSFGMGKS